MEKTYRVLVSVNILIDVDARNEKQANRLAEEMIMDKDTPCFRFDEIEFIDWEVI